MRVIIRANTIEQEKQIIEHTKKKIKWLKQNCYICVLPKKPLKQEYNIKDYKQGIAKIKKEWKKVEKEFFQRLIKLFGKKVEETYVITLTKYGVGGSYNLPNLVYVNISKEYGFYNPIETIKHEIIHLIMQEFVVKNKLSHPQKEELIKLIESIVSNNLDIIDDYIFYLYSKLKR